MKIVGIVLLSVVLFGFQSESATVITKNFNANNLFFLGLADWGGTSDSTPTAPGEIAAARGMATLASQNNAQFVLALGDNFYTQGVDSDESSRFQTTFENVYNQPSLQVPWYVEVGNHDSIRNVSAQIEYTKLSKRWTFPDYYYTLNFTFGSGTTLQIIMIDTVTLSGNTDLNENPFDQPPGPLDPQAAEDQWTFIEDQLQSSKADYLIVAGHYPVWSACSHGPTQALVDRLKPLLEKYGASGYMCGHDHCTEHIIDSGMNYMLFGAGKECCYSASNIDKCPKGSVKFIASQGFKMDSGFASFDVTATGFQVTYHDQDGKVIYQPASIPPRHTKQ